MYVSFNNKNEFINLLNNLPLINKEAIFEHDFVFELQLKTAMQDNWKDTKNTPKDSDAWVKCIESGIDEKKAICKKVNPKVRLNATAHFIRRNLLHNGVVDNIKSPYTSYSINGVNNTNKLTLF
jgi:hypothetical protein